MSRRHIPETPLHALRRARKIVRHMRDIAADCDAYALAIAHRDILIACAVKALGIFFGALAERTDRAISRFVIRHPEIFHLPPPSRKLITQKRNNR